MSRSGRPGRPSRALRIAMFLLAASLAACGSTASAVGETPGTQAPPPLVRAKCGSCHGTPSPDPDLDLDAIRRSHEGRLHLDPEQSAAIFRWLSAPGGQ